MPHLDRYIQSTPAIDISALDSAVISTPAFLICGGAPSSPLLLRGGAGGNGQRPGTVEAVAEELSMATEHYEKAIAQLEALAQSDGSTLDASVAATLRQNIKTIDQAIIESRTALTQDPGS